MELSKARMRRLFSRIKWPGWFAIFWGIFLYLPDWQTRIQFWIEAARKVNEKMADIAAIVASPLFGAGLIVVGVGYLLVVGESERAIRHPIWPILGGSILGVVGVAFCLVLFVGYIVVQTDHGTAARIENLTHSNEQLGKEVAHLQEQLRPRQITKRDEFVRALREAGPSILNLAYIDGDRDASDLFADLLNLLVAGGWEVPGRAALSTTPWKGVRVMVKDRNVVPVGAILLVKLLRQNEIAAGLVEDSVNVTLTTTTFSVEIGYRP